MLTCALIVWILQPQEWDKKIIRNTYLTEQECISAQTEYFQCLKIDKRYSLTKQEWEKDNCKISEHKWLGTKK